MTETDAAETEAEGTVIITAKWRIDRELEDAKHQPLSRKWAYVGRLGREVAE